MVSAHFVLESRRLEIRLLTLITYNSKIHVQFLKLLNIENNKKNKSKCEN